jgi:hypothetical protein
MALIRWAAMIGDSLSIVFAVLVVACSERADSNEKAGYERGPFSRPAPLHGA